MHSWIMKPNAVSSNENLLESVMHQLSQQNISDPTDPSRTIANPFSAMAKQKSRSFQAIAKHATDAVNEFLTSSNLIKPGVTLPSDVPNTFYAKQTVSNENFNNEVNLETNVSGSKLAALAAKCGVHKDRIPDAVAAVALLLARAKASASSADYLDTHFSRQNFKHGDNTAINGNSIYSPALNGVINNFGMPSVEAFGCSTDRVYTDLKSNITVTILMFHKGMLDRAVPRCSTAVPNITYRVPYANIYDMMKSNDTHSSERVHGDHIKPVIELYADPRDVSNALTPIVPLHTNDPNNVPYDGYIAFNSVIDLFYAAKIPNQLGYSHHNYTDLISEGVILKSVIIQISDGSKTESIEINVHGEHSSRLLMQPDTKDSAMRATQLLYTTKLDHLTKTVDNQASTILSKCNSEDSIALTLFGAFNINLSWGEARGTCTPTFAAYNRSGAECSPEFKAFIEKLTIKSVCYSLDARYSEENLRKSNLAVQHQIQLFDYEICNSRNILVDYSPKQFLPDYLLSLVTEITTLGQDHRGLDIIVTELLRVYDRSNAQNKDPNLRRVRDRLGFTYPSGQLVRPTAYIHPIDIANVDSIRSSDYASDVRSYVEWELLNLTSLLFQNSFYRQQIGTEKPCFKVITSSIIIDNLLAIEHIHDHLNYKSDADGSEVEFRRVLPNGVILECISVTYNYMRDKIVMIPYRKEATDDVLNFGQNWDFGTLLAHYTPTENNAVWKRLYANSRASVIHTNPSGLYCEVLNISKVIDMTRITNPTSTRLPSVVDQLAAENAEAVAAATAAKISNLHTA